MLTKEQRDSVLKGFGLGMTDAIISRYLSLHVMQVFSFRKSQGISAKTVVSNRYDHWIKMLLEGYSLETIGTRYGVTGASVRIILWRTRNFSFLQNKEILAAARKARLARLESINDDYAL